MTERIDPQFRDQSWRGRMGLLLSDHYNMLFAVISRDPMGPYYRRIRRTEEGFIMPEQAGILRRIVGDTRARSIADIGFNAGHSAYNFLIAHPDARVTSYEKRDDEMVRSAKQRIDRFFPGRHELVTGDTRFTLAAAAIVGTTYDLIFIDGGHTPEEAMSDLNYSRKLSHEHTVIVMDDTTDAYSYGAGPTRAWDAAVERGDLVESVHYDTRDNRSFSVGHFVSAHEAVPAIH